MSADLSGSTLIEVTTTVGSQPQARQLAAELLRQRLAGCVQIVAVESHYHWEGRQQQDPEYQLLIKTTLDQFAGIEQCLQQHHPYTLPQLLAVPVCASSPAYADWLRGQLAG
ncbi:divalent-cation tolerance protein CutA [Frateuria aurantia]